METVTEVKRVNRSLRLPLIVDDPTYRIVRAGVKQYRAAIARCASLTGDVMMVSATLEKTEDNFLVKPNNEKAKQVLQLVMGSPGKLNFYELRRYVLDQLCPNWMSTTWDSLRRDLDAAWKAKDPEFQKVDRRFLFHQGTRRPPNFVKRGITFQRASNTARLGAGAETNPHRGAVIQFRWDKEIGPIETLVARTSPQNWQIFCQLRDDPTEGHYQLGACTLNLDDDGRPFTTVSYSVPVRDLLLDPDRICIAKFGGEENVLTVSGPVVGHTEAIGSANAKQFLCYMLERKKALGDSQGACGSPTRSYGHRKAWKDTQVMIARLTNERATGVTQRNHAWARRIVSLAQKWGCGSVRVEIPGNSKLYGFDWNISQFKEFVKYKADELKMNVFWEEANV